MAAPPPEPPAPIVPQSTLLGDLWNTSEHTSPLRFALAGLFFTAASAALLLAFGFPAAGMFSVFLAAAALATPFDHILTANRAAIWEARQSPWQANRRTAWSLLGLFMGMVLAYVGVAVVLGQEGLRMHFGFVVEVIGPSGDILSRRFGEFGPLLTHNLTVLSAVVALTFTFRQYGALLVLGWNAATWGIVLTLLVVRALDATHLPPAHFALAAAGAVLPHLLLEAMGYVCGALAAVFTSRAVVRYELTDDRSKRVLRASATLLVVAVALLAAGALAEQWFAPWVLDRLR